MLNLYLNSTDNVLKLYFIIKSSYLSTTFDIWWTKRPLRSRWTIWLISQRPSLPKSTSWRTGPVLKAFVPQLLRLAKIEIFFHRKSVDGAKIIVIFEISGFDYVGFDPFLEQFLEKIVVCRRFSRKNDIFGILKKICFFCGNFWAWNSRYRF